MKCVLQSIKSELFSGEICECVQWEPSEHISSIKVYVKQFFQVQKGIDQRPAKIDGCELVLVVVSRREA